MAGLRDLWSVFNQDDTPYGYVPVGRNMGDGMNAFVNGVNVGTALRNASVNSANNRRRDDSRNQSKKSIPGGTSGSIGADENGIYGVSGQPTQNSISIGANENGVYGTSVTPQQNKYTFNDSDYIPSAENGYHLGDYPQTEMYADPKDFQRQMASNAIGYNLGSLEPIQQTWFPKNGGGTESDHGINITDQNIGQNYNNRINSQYPNGTGIPTKPQTGFGSVFGNNDNGVFGANPFHPVVSLGDQALTDGGTITSANLFGQNQQQRDLSNLRNIQDWMAADAAQGVTNPIISMMRYQAFMELIEAQIRDEELRNAFFVLQNPDSSNQDKMNAIALIQYAKKDPYMEENQRMKRDKAMYDMGYLPEEFGYKNGTGEEYGGDDENARSIYSHLASKGVPANVIAGIMGNLQAESGFNSGAVGDNGQSIGLAQWYDSRGNNLRNFAQQRGKDWTDIPTQVDFLLGEIQQSNPDLLQRMSKLSPHEAAILFHDEFEKSADTPEMKARRGDYAESIFGNRKQGNVSRYRRDPYRVSPREQFDYTKQQNTINNRLKEQAIAARYAAKRGKNMGQSYETPNPVMLDEAKGLFAAEPNEQSADALAKELSSKYMSYFSKFGSNDEARNKLYEELKKDKSVSGALEGNQNQYKLLWDIVVNAEKYALNNTTNDTQQPQSQNTQNNQPEKQSQKDWQLPPSNVKEEPTSTSDFKRKQEEMTQNEEKERRKYMISDARTWWDRALRNYEKGRNIK